MSIGSDQYLVPDYKIVPLDPVFRSDFECLETAYGWVQARAWAYPHTGGHQTLGDYLKDALEPNVKNLAVFLDHSFICLITVIKGRTIPEETGHFEGDEYALHVTVPRRFRHQSVTVDACRSVIHHLFKAFNAQLVYTSSPVYESRHRHVGSMRLCEACGARPTGEIQTDEYGNQWVFYEITRPEWERLYTSIHIEPAVNEKIGNTDGRENKTDLEQSADCLLFQ